MPALGSWIGFRGGGNENETGTQNIEPSAFIRHLHGISLPESSLHVSP